MVSTSGARGRMFLGPGIVLGVAAVLAVVLAQLPEGGGAQAQPASDSFAYVTATPTPPFTNIQGAVDATTAVGESPRGGIASTVRYRFAPSRDTVLAANTPGREYNTVRPVRTGPSAESPPPADRNDRAFGVQPQVIFGATGGSAHYPWEGRSFGDTGDPSSDLADGALLGSILGTVTDEGTRLPLSDIRVVVYDTSYSQWGSDYTDSLGNYSVGGLPSGNYEVRFQDSGSLPPPTPTPTATAMAAAPTTITRAATSRPAGTYAFEWYDDKEDFWSADPVPVASGSDTAGINAALALGGSISGTVTGEDTGVPLSDICVSVFDTSWDWLGYDARTGSSGKYSVKGLPTGNYKLWFGECSSRTPGYAYELYNNKGMDFDAADPVHVTAGFETAGINAALAPGGSISGTVTEESTETLLSGICATAYDISRRWGVRVRTGSSGTYKVKGLPSGDYKVRFEDCGSPALHISEWYNDKEDFDSADPVHVSAGSDRGGTDAALAAGGAIEGLVTDEETGAPLPDICAHVYDMSHTWADSVRTDFSGTYSVGGLPSGDYKVEFRDCGWPALYISEWYDDKEDFDSADPVSVTAGFDTSGINAALALPVASIGIYQPSSGLWFLRNDNSSGMADLTFSYGAGLSDVTPVAGDWNNHATDTIGLYRASDGIWFLRNSNSSGGADLTFSYGAGISGAVPVVGDWNNDGDDTIGIYRASDGQWFLRNENTSGVADLTFSYGAGISDGVAVVGDWDGDGTDTIGIYRASDGMWFLRNDNSTGVADLTFSYGAGISGGVPVVGDWDGGGTDTTGIYRPSDGQWFLRNDNSTGVADLAFSYGAGISGGVAAVGDWDGS